MSEHNITVEGGTSVRLTTAGKYCDRDIIVTAMGGGGDVEANMGTCTVKITVPSTSNYYSAYEKVASGAVTHQIDRNYASGTLTKTIRCDSVAYIQGSTVKGVEVTEGELLRLVSGYGIAYKTPSTAGVTVQITLTA